MIVYKLREDGTFDYSDTITCEPNAIPEGYAIDDTTDHVKADGTRPTDAEILEQARQAKITELYKAYQSELTNELVSNIVWTDGNTLIFGYTEKNASDYGNIVSAFAIDPQKTQSIVGTKSHGKVYINRDQAIQLSRDGAEHEGTLYAKFISLRTQAQQAVSQAELESVTWG